MLDFKVIRALFFFFYQLNFVEIEGNTKYVSSQTKDSSSPASRLQQKPVTGVGKKTTKLCLCFLPDSSNLEN